MLLTEEKKSKKKRRRMPANAVELVNLPGVAVKATISNIVWVGGGLSLIFKTVY